MRDFLWLNLRELPYFRSMLRAVEAGFYQELELPTPVLDVGCGDGHFAAVSFDHMIDVGLDPWGAPIQEAARRGGYRMLVQADGGRAPFPDGIFASAISNSVLEHIPHIDMVLADTARLLKPGAPFIFCVPNPDYLNRLSIPQFLKSIGLSGLGKAYTEWFRKMSRVEHADGPEVWQQRLEKAGFQLERWWHYFPPKAWHVMEWGHYFGAPTLLPHALFGRWILAPTRWNLAITDHLVRPYTQAKPHTEGVFTFYIARKKDAPGAPRQENSTPIQLHSPAETPSPSGPGPTKANPFDETYFKTGTYATVSFERYSQYWWSNRFYSGLARKNGPPDGRVLEVGCGLGHLLGWLANSHQVYGVDINEWALEQARQNVPEGHFQTAPAEDLSLFPDGYFNIVISKHVVEHLPEPEKSIAEISRVLAKGGLFLLATPNLDSRMRKVKKENWIGYRDRTHISLKRPAVWLGYLRAHGLRPQRTFSDGFWDAPYIPFLPARLQKLLFGAPGGLQAILGWSIIPITLGESLIVIAKKYD